MLILFSGKSITVQDLPQEFQAKQSETHTFTLPETGINYFLMLLLFFEK